jgi:hypothetical protein
LKDSARFAGLGVPGTVGDDRDGTSYDVVAGRARLLQERAQLRRFQPLR